MLAEIVCCINKECVFGWCKRFDTSIDLMSRSSRYLPAQS